MFAYLAFKALTGRYPDALKSAQQGTLWEIDLALGLPCLKAEEGTFEAGRGVYAATVDEAQSYADEYGGIVYLVTPLPGRQAVVGEAGWRAEAALCLGALTEENIGAITHLILAAHAQGLSQVPAILRWANLVACLETDQALWPTAKSLIARFVKGETEDWLVSLLPHLDTAGCKLEVAKSIIAMHDAGDRVNERTLRWAILTVSAAIGRLAMPEKISLKDVVDIGGNEGRAEWLAELLHYLSNDQFNQLCSILLKLKGVIALSEVRRAWLRRLKPPIKMTGGKMSYRKTWDVLVLAKAHGTSGCPQDVLKAAFKFVVRRGDLDWICQLGVYCDDERWAKVIRETILAGERAILLYLASGITHK